jgi:hypothetical protein
MTLEELKAEAKKHGYKLTKEYKYIKLHSCICGNKHPTLEWDIAQKQRYYTCRKCKFRANGAKSKYEAIAKWNEFVEQVQALEYITSDIDTLIDARKE